LQNRAQILQLADDLCHKLLRIEGTIKFSLPIIFICTTRRWIPASANMNQGDGKGDLVGGYGMGVKF